ncbi:MAG: cytochrome c [Sulfurimonadaceae bacterium]|jgi:mono/diheme cytochrome c family protein|nr:cytochrome c [Sulfurimonadaceae bacterium]
MNHFFKYALIVACFTTLNLDAAVYKGQREYIKQCASCHGAGQAFVGKKYTYEWEVLMEKKGSLLRHSIWN